jgi:paraquat-inducible protein A
MSAMSATALGRNLYVCEVCEQLNRGIEGHCHCARCGANLHGRTPNSVRRAWAFLIAAMIMYIPANLLPVLHTGNLFGGARTDTIMSGVVHLWETGSAGLAIILFVASIVIPFAKILSLGFLLITTQRRSQWKPLLRTKLYRATHWIGRWSMTDIYVGATLVALVHLGPFANVEPGDGAIAFGAVVVLTMLATMSFDPRVMWDAATDD